MSGVSAPGGRTGDKQQVPGPHCMTEWAAGLADFRKISPRDVHCAYLPCADRLMIAAPLLVRDHTIIRPNPNNLKSLQNLQISRACSGSSSIVGKKLPFISMKVYTCRQSL